MDAFDMNDASPLDLEEWRTDIPLLYPNPIRPRNMDEFAATIEAAYVQHVHFESPTLEIPPLISANRDGRPFYSPCDIIHAALFAATLPWLDSHLLQDQGYGTRAAAFGSCVQRLEDHLLSNHEANPIRDVQALLLMAYAAGNIPVKASRDTVAQWIRLAATKLVSQEFLSHISPSGSLYRRLCSCAFVTEQLHLLRYSLETRQLDYQPVFIVDQATSMPLSVEDFDLAATTLADGMYSEYWSRMHKAILFIRRKALCEQMATLLSGLGDLVTSRSPRARARGYHTPGTYTHTRTRGARDQFWQGVQALMRWLAEIHHADSACHLESLDHLPLDQSILALSTSLQLLFHRIVMALLAVRPWPAAMSSDHDQLWRSLRWRRQEANMTKMMRLVETCLQRLSDGDMKRGAETCLLRPMVVVAQVLAREKKGNKKRNGATAGHHALRMPDLAVQARQLLERCLAANDSLWEGEPVVQEVDEEMDVPSLEHLCSADVSPAADQPQTPGEAGGEEEEDMMKLETIPGQKRMLAFFDGMWDPILAGDGLDPPGG